MTADPEISEKTHEVLGEELDDYDPAAAQAAAEEWVETAPPPLSASSQTSFQVVETGTDQWRWRLLGEEGTTIAESRRTFSTKRAALEAVGSFRESVEEAPVRTTDSV